MQNLILAAPSPKYSKLARLLACMGLYHSPSQPQQPGQNKKNNSPNLNQLNDSLFFTSQSSWYHISNIPLGETLIDASSEMQSDQKRVLASLDLHCPWFSSDPGMCLLLPYWKYFLSNPLCLIYIEHPLSVANILRQRWRFPMVFGAALWEYYMRAAIVNSRAYPRFCINHNELMQKPGTTISKFVQELKACGMNNLNWLDDNQINVVMESKHIYSNDFDTSDMDFVNHEQLALYQALSDGNLDLPGLNVMSKSGEDILKSYGRLRAGFDLLKKQNFDAGFSRNSEDNNATFTSKELESTNIQSISGDEEIVDINVFLDDMPPFEIACHKEASIIQDLIQALVRKSETATTNNEMIYLQLGEQTIYFPVSQLKALKISENLDSNAENLSGECQYKSEPDNYYTAKIYDGPSEKSVAVVVLGCLMPQYDNAIEIIQNTWGARKYSNIDIFYIFGSHLQQPKTEQAVLDKYAGQQVTPLPSFEAMQCDNVIVCGCADSIHLQQDCLLRKRLIAFSHLLEHYNHDYIYTVCASSYVDQKQLAAYIDTLSGERLFHGPVGVCQFTDLPYISGASMLFSRDLLVEMVSNKFQLIEDNQFRYPDDVAMGSWIARNVSNKTEKEIVDCIKNGKQVTDDNTFVAPTGRHMVDFVNAEIKDQAVVENAYHYHFSINSMEQMIEFDKNFL